MHDNIIQSFIKRNNKNNNEFFRFGYDIFGPVLYGFLSNMHKKAKELELEHIYFFSRDGYLLKKAYDEYFEIGDKLTSSYLYVSRKALVTPMLEKDYSLNQIKEILGIENQTTIGAFLRRLTNNIDNYSKYLDMYNLTLKDIIIFNEKNNKIEMFYNSLKDELFDELNKQRFLLKMYLKQEKFCNYKKIAVMDLGWRGSLQFALDKIVKNSLFNVETYGFYMGLNKNFIPYKNNGMKSEGYIFMPDDTIIANRIAGAVGLVELLFSAPHGSIIGYYLNDNIVRPIFDEFELDKMEFEKINILQQGALQFIKDFSHEIRYVDLNIKKELFVNNFVKYISSPSLKDVERFGDFTFDDFGVTRLAKPLSLIRYIFSPNQFKIDFKQSRWKIGFMKRLFKIKFNYFKIYNVLKQSKH